MGRNKAFQWAFAVSFVFHLSTVTLFRIVIYFPREDVQYVNFAIVEAVVDAADLEEREVLKVPSREGALERAASSESLDEVDRFMHSIPPIQLPTIEFAGQDLLRMRTQGLEIRSRYEELFRPPRQDAWSRFGRGLAIVGDVITRVTQGAGTLDEESPDPISHPAPGFDAYLEWMEPPTDRQPISVTKIEALWGLDPAHLTEPIVLYFKVNRDGKVVGIVPQMEDDEGIVMSAVESLFAYRFEAIGEDGPGTQEAMLLIRADQEYLQ